MTYKEAREFSPLRQRFMKAENSAKSDMKKSSNILYNKKLYMLISNSTKISDKD